MPASGHNSDRPLATLVGQGLPVRGIDGVDREYVDLDAAASTPALPAVADAVAQFLPSYASVHRGAGDKSQRSTRVYEAAREAALAFAGSTRRDDVAILCRNTTEAINHLAYRLALDADDVVLTTVVEHHANLLPWRRVARVAYVECGRDGTFELEAVIEALRASPRPRLLALTGASNVTGWLPPIEAIIEAAHAAGVPVLVDAAQLAPHRPLPASADYLAWSGHKMYAPFGTGVLVGPRATFSTGDPFLAGGGAVELVDLDEVVWTDPPEHEEAGSPNVVGAVALHAAIEELERIGFPALAAREQALAERLRSGLGAIEGVSVLGASDVETLAVATFVVEGVHHGLVAARLAAEWGIGVRHGCFCAHPYLLRLLDVGPVGVARFRDSVLRGDRREIPGAVRASASLATTDGEVDRLLEAVALIAGGAPPPVPYVQAVTTGDFAPTSLVAGDGAERVAGGGCSRG